MERSNTITLPRGCRNRWYFPIVMPLKNGIGPASEKDCDEITWEVWDQVCDTYGSFKYLGDAIDKAEELNEQRENTLNVKET